MPSEGHEPHLDQDGSGAASARGAAVRVVYLSSAQRALLAAIEERIGAGEFWIASNAEIRDAVEAIHGTRPSERSVSRHLAVLRRERVIVTSGQPGRPIMIRLTSPARDGEEWVVRAKPERDGRDVVREAGRQPAIDSRHDLRRHLRRHPEMAAAAEVDSHGPSISSDPSSSSDVAAAAADPSDVAAAAVPDSRHSLTDVAAADVAAGVAAEVGTTTTTTTEATTPEEATTTNVPAADLDAWATATNEALRHAARNRPHPEIVSALREREVREPTDELVARIAKLRPDEAAFFWHQMDAWGIGKPWTYAMNCVDTAVSECNPGTAPTDSPAAQEAAVSPPRGLLGQLTRHARRAALGALRGLAERIGDER